MLKFWILDEKRRPVRATFEAWGEWFQQDRVSSETGLRQVASDEVCGYRVSTVFLGTDHNFNGEGPPIYWETMVFGEGPYESETDRCAGTWEQAEEMHRRMCRRVREALGQKESPPANPGP